MRDHSRRRPVDPAQRAARAATEDEDTDVDFHFDCELELELLSLAERRVSDRRRRRVPVLVLPAERGAREFWAETSDVSGGGLFVSTNTQVRRGALIALVLVPSDAPPIRALARLVHTAAEGGFGCAFEVLSSEARSYLVRWLEPPPALLAPISGEYDIPALSPEEISAASTPVAAPASKVVVA